MRLSIRSKLFIGICLPITVIYLLVLYVEYKIRAEEASNSMQQYMKELTEGEASEIDVKLSSIAQLCRTSAEILGHYHPDNAEEVINLLHKAISSNNDIYGMAFAYEPFTIISDRKFFCPYFYRNSADGKIIFLESSLEDAGYASEQWYSLAKEKGTGTWTEPYYDEYLGKILMCTYTTPIIIKGRFAGVSAADLSIASLKEEVDDMNTVGGYSAIISGTGRVISHPVKSYIMNETVFSIAKRVGSPQLEDAGRKMTAGKNGFFKYLDPDTGKIKWIVYSPIKSSGWSFAAVIMEDTVMAPIYAHIKRSLILLLAGLAVIAVTIFIMSSRITKPLELLAGAVDRLGKGDLEAKVTGLKNTDEIGVLARAYNKMLGDLKENIASRIREETARKSVEAELNVAREIQLSLLPRRNPPFPERNEFALSALNLPAKFVAGDFFDFFILDEDTLAFAIADVSGKGIPAAMFMAVTRTVLRDVSQSLRSPAAIMKHVSDLLEKDNERLMFVTVFYGHYKFRTGELCYVNAGHNPPFLLRKGGGFEELCTTGPLAAVLPEASYGESLVSLQPDDTLVCFTDGVTEAYSEGGELFGDERFRELLSKTCQEDVERINSCISEEILRYSSGDLKDDVTLLTLRRKQV